jgi:hypothetical protein
MDDPQPQSGSPSPNKRPRRWVYLQFSLTSVVLVTVICAVAITWWLRRRDQEEIRSLRATAESLQAEIEFRESVAGVCRSLDLRKPTHQLAMEVLLTIDREGYERRSLVNGGEHLDVAVFGYPSRVHPGSNYSGAVLLQGYEVVDIVIRNSSTRYEHLEAKLEDHDQDGSIELVFHCQPANLNEPSSAVRYSITNKGFARLTPDPAADGVRVLHGVD